MEIMGQFLLTSFLVTCMQYLFFSEKVFRHMSGNKRAVGMLLSVLGITSLEIWIFGWFPIDMWEPWVYFFLSFLISTGISICVMYLKIKAENRRLEEGLERMKEKWNEDEVGEK